MRISRSYKRLFIFSLVINLLGLLGGGFYVYETKSVFVYRYNKHVKGASYVEDARYYRQRLNVFHLLQKEMEGKKAIIFAGDSLIDTFEWAEYFNDLEDTMILNRGIGGDTIERLMDRFEITFLAGPIPNKIFIMVGINDMNRQNFDMENFIGKYHSLLEKLSSRVSPDKICIHSILPVRLENISSQTIKKVNESLKIYAHEKGLCYIDLYDKLADSTGQLDARYSVDGIHLTSEGYRIWLEILKPYILK
ncbi:MAG: GDSL-type esterase/lipase family protein [Nitrospirota bacterium]